MDEPINLPLLRRLNLNHLVSFLTIAESQNFRIAAARLNISQSALSVHIQQLEETLRVRLFNRTTRSVTLTGEGKRLLPVARHLTLEITLVAGDFWEEAALQRGIATLAATPSLAAVLVPPVLKAVAKAHPRIQIHIQVKDSSNAVADAIRQGEADVGLMSLGEDPENLAVTKLHDDELVAVVPVSNSRLAKLKQVTLRQLAEFPFLIQPRGSSFREVLDTHLREQGIIINIHQEVLHAEVLVGLVGHGLGVAILLERALSPLKLKGCRVMKLRGVSSRAVAMVTPARGSVSPSAGLLRKFIVDVSRQIPTSRLRSG